MLYLMPKRLNYILLIYMDDSLIYVLYLSEVFILLHHIFKGLCFLTMSYRWCFFQPLHMKSPSFMGDKKITLSWMEQPKKPASTVAGLDACHPIFQFFLLDPIFSSYSFVLWIVQSEEVPTCYKWEWPSKQEGARRNAESACEQSIWRIVSWWSRQWKRVGQGRPRKRKRMGWLPLRSFRKLFNLT